MVSKDSVLHELERILVSALFSGKKQASNFLQYITAETLAGRGKRITQYGIAIEALGKQETYCPTESPAVRVEAGRVRKLLKEYYQTEGMHNPVHFVLPTGQYMPEFVGVTVPRAGRLHDPHTPVSSGPRVYIVCDDPARINDERLRRLVYTLRADLPVTLGRMRTIRIALGAVSDAADAADAQNTPAQVWQKQQAEFVLQLSVSTQAEQFCLRYALIHTLSEALVGTYECSLAMHDISQPVLDAKYTEMMTQLFSLHRGCALACWSRHWSQQKEIPAPYQALVAHVRFVQESSTEEAFTAFRQACLLRLHHYPEDALANLQYAVACLYAYMFGERSAAQNAAWHQQAGKALELNPDDAWAHMIFALSSYQQGDTELCKAEIQTALSINPQDAGCRRLISVGLCALGAWEWGFFILKKLVGFSSGHPDPLQTIPCLFYFRGGEYMRQAQTAEGFPALGGWEKFGEISASCSSRHCGDCILKINQAVERLDEPVPETPPLKNVREHKAFLLAN